MFGKGNLLIIKAIKTTIFFILKILINIGNVWERTLIYHKRLKKDNIFHLENINRKLGMFGKEFLFIIESIKKTILFILKILIIIGNVWERTLINHKRYKKDNILHLENINKNWECLGKNFYLS